MAGRLKRSYLFLVNYQIQSLLDRWYCLSEILFNLFDGDRIVIIYFVGYVSRFRVTIISRR